MVDTTYICCGRVFCPDRLDEIEKSLKLILNSYESQKYLDTILTRPTKQKIESLSALSGLLYLCRHEGINIGELKFMRDEKCKPYLEGSQYHISFSHSGGLFASALSVQKIGIDIETKRYEKEHAYAVAQRFFCKEEIDFIESEPQKNFIKVWTRKEAYVKMCGSTLSEQINKFNTQKSVYDFSDFEYRGGMVALCRPFAGKTEIYTYNI